jgi:Na+/phosphate symporter
MTEVNMLVFITSILVFPFLVVLSILLFAVTFLKVGLQTALGIFTKDGLVEIPEISLKILD